MTSQVADGYRVHRCLVVAAGVIAVVLTCTTVLNVLLASRLSGRWLWISGFFNLSQENSLAAWYSGMLLFAVGVLCYDGWVLTRNDRIRVARSWLVLSAIMILLSLDEVGSFHERLELIPYGIVLGLVPAALILLGALWYTIAGFRRAADQVRTASWCILAFSLFATVPLQEVIEHLYATTPARQAVSFGLEEGTEVLASTILFAVTLKNTMALYKQRSAEGTRLLELAVEARKYIVPIAAIAMPLLAFITAGVTDHFRGRPADWFIASALLLAAFVELRTAIIDARALKAASSLAFCLASMAVVFAPGSMLTSDVGLSRRAFIISAALLIAAFLWAFGGSRRPAVIAALAASAIVYLLAFESLKDKLFTGFLLTQLIALFAYMAATANLHSIERVPRNTERS